MLADQGDNVQWVLQPGVGQVIDGVELVEGFDENCAAAAGWVENTEALQFLLPGFPEADDFRVEERFGFERHLPGDRVCGRRGKTKRIEHQTSNIEQPASKDGDRFTVAQPQEMDLDKLA